MLRDLEAIVLYDKNGVAVSFVVSGLSRVDVLHCCSVSFHFRGVFLLRAQGYINQVERSGKKVGNNKLVAAFPDDANVGQRPAAGGR